MTRGLQSKLLVEVIGLKFRGSQWQCMFVTVAVFPAQLAMAQAMASAHSAVRTSRPSSMQIPWTVCQHECTQPSSFGLLQLLPKNAKHPRTWSTHVCWNNTHDFAMGLSSTHHHASGTSCTDLECSKNNGCLVRSWFSALSLNPRNVSTYPQSSDPSQQQITLRRCQGLTLRPFVGLSKYPYEVMKTMNK